LLLIIIIIIIIIIITTTTTTTTTTSYFYEILLRQCFTIIFNNLYYFAVSLLLSSSTQQVTGHASKNIARVIMSRRMGRAGHVARTGDMRNAYKVLGGRPEVRRPLGRSRRRWEDNVRLYLRVVGWGSYGGLDSSGSGWRPVAGCCEHGNELSGYIKGW